MDDAQRVAAEIALSVLADDGFILAGGQALAEHGVIDRLSKNVDLFALHRKHTPETFAASVQKMTKALESAGYTVSITRRHHLPQRSRRRGLGPGPAMEGRRQLDAWLSTYTAIPMNLENISLRAHPRLVSS